tara:strand:- start:5767 stop:5985 length:219 start_codon:yes stop_codon:yes gene_type:complete
MKFELHKYMLTIFKIITTKLERVRGIEPPSSAWEAEVLPLNYARYMFDLYKFYIEIEKRILIKLKKDLVTLT